MRTPLKCITYLTSKLIETSSPTLLDENNENRPTLCLCENVNDLVTNSLFIGDRFSKSINHDTASNYYETITAFADTVDLWYKNSKNLNIYIFFSRRNLPCLFCVNQFFVRFDLWHLFTIWGSFTHKSHRIDLHPRIMFFLLTINWLGVA